MEESTVVANDEISKALLILSEMLECTVSTEIALNQSQMNTVKPRLSGHVRSQENSRINEVSVYMKHDLFAHVLYVEC